MEQRKQDGLVSAITSIKSNLNISDYHKEMDRLLKGLSEDDKSELGQGLEELMENWSISHTDGPNPYARSFRYFNPAGAA